MPRTVAPKSTRPAVRTRSKESFEREGRLKPDQVDGEHEGNGRHVVNAFDDDGDERSTRPDARIAHRKRHRTHKLASPPDQKDGAETDRGGCKEVSKPGCARVVSVTLPTEKPGKSRPMR